MDRLWYIQAMEYYSSTKWAIHEKTCWNFKCILLSERRQSEKVTCCVDPTIWRSGKVKTMEKVKKSVVSRGFVGQGWIGRTQRVFRAVKVFGMILYLWILSSKSTEYTTPRVNPQANHGLWVIMMCHPCRFTRQNKCATPVGDTDTGGGHTEGRGEISVPSTEFCYESKTALKIKVYF